ncbi:MAG: mononuclear molybdenum enzyme YedY [Candidatus Eisenbacteria bacterium RBG_16_71_46]|nr:MAG: mononuclear molybdenum enzyme YedY [Candidatus Eisenbacteria bacterium RBG_16_71_46]OGF21142.1 MAG: mononuclear molybdenum enzyme YedY [Candidatus Eisenbacteria bacterium RBG_19FT_COMBO_70_11]
MHLPRRRGWEIPDSSATPEAAFVDRRDFLKLVGLAGAGLAVGAGLTRAARALAAAAPAVAAPGAARSIYPARRNPAFVLDRPLTGEQVAATYNNFYEFTEQKDAVARLVGKFEPRPWRIEIAGMVETPRQVDVGYLIRSLPVEERLYRHRCVEAWAMAVPWTGIPMREFVKWAKPTSSARFVRMVSFLRPDEAPNQKTATWYPWPYYEGLRLEEAMNDLTLLAVGIYGHDLPKQHGAPIRLVTPWKYGFKSIKSIVRFEFTDRQPKTFWNDVAAKEYDFLANVNPKVPHPRWSQATERMIGSDERRPTLPYNGYGQWAAGLYDKG